MEDCVLNNPEIENYSADLDTEKSHGNKSNKRPIRRK